MCCKQHAADLGLAFLPASVFSEFNSLLLSILLLSFTFSDEIVQLFVTVGLRGASS